MDKSILKSSNGNTRPRETMPNPTRKVKNLFAPHILYRIINLLSALYEIKIFSNTLS